MNEQPKNIPKFYLPPKTSNKKTLVLDLDETLVHSQFFEFSIPSDITIKIEIEQEIYDIHVLVRPGVEKFIEIMKDYFEIIIFTASISKYADILMNIIDPNNYCPYRLFREHCSYINNNYVKDLTKLGRNLKDIIIVDNSPLSYSFHPNNGLPILSWFDDYNDFELEKITPILIFLSMVDDVRQFIPKLVKNNEISYIDAENLMKKHGFIKEVPDNIDKNNKIEENDTKEKITKTSINKNKKIDDKNKNKKKGKKFNINIQIVQNNINNINNIIEEKQNKDIKNKLIKYLGIINNTEQKNILKQKQINQNILQLKQKNIISNITKPNTVMNTQSNNKDITKKGHKRQNTFNTNLNSTNFFEKYKEKHFIKINNLNTTKNATKKSIKEGKNTINDNKAYFQHIRNILNKKRKRIKTPNNINTIALIANNIKYNFKKYKSNSTTKTQKRNKSNRERTKLLLPLDSSEHILSKHIYNLSNILTKSNITNNNSNINNNKRNYNKINKIKIASKYKSISNRKSYNQNDFLNISINANNIKNKFNKLFKAGQKILELPHHQKQKSYNEINIISKFKNNLIKNKESKKNMKSNQTRLNTNINEFKNRLIKRAFGNFKKINLKNIDFITKKEPKKIQINFNYKNNENAHNTKNNINNKNIYTLYKTIDKSERKKGRENTLLNNMTENLINKSYRKISHQKTISYNMNSSLNISNILNPKNIHKNKFTNNFVPKYKQINKIKSPILNNNNKSNSKTLFANRAKNIVNIKNNNN